MSNNNNPSKFAPASTLKVAVVILNWNGKALLQQFLPSVIQFSEDAMIYVADNASTDDSIQYISEYFPQVKIIQNSENYGFARGYNEALKHVEEEIYVLLNSDVEVTAGWLAPILQQFNNEPQTAIIQPKIRDYKNKDYFEYAGAAGGFIDKYGYPYCRGRIFDSIEKDIGQYDNDITIFWASGACFFIRKTIFRELGGFDNSFFAHQEEIDLCWRSFNKGYSTKFCYQSVVFHVGGATLNAQTPQKTYLNFRNSLYSLTKNVPSNQLYQVLFIRMVLDGLAAILFLTKGQFSHIAAILRAHGHFYRHFGKFYKARANSHANNYYKVKSIVYQYFALKKRLYKSF